MPPQTERKRLTGPVSAAGHATGVGITAGVTAATPEEIATAAVTAREVLETAITSDRPANISRLEDVALELQLSRPGPARDKLAALLEPLEHARNC